MIYNVSHIDLDGYGCTLFMKSLRFADEYLNVDYDGLKGLLAELPKDSHLIITDLSATEDMRELLESFRQITFIDHHETSLWMNERPLKNATYTIVDTTHCATYLTWQFFKQSEITKESDIWFAGYSVLINDYDLWIHENPDSKRLNALLYISNRDYFINEALMVDVKTLLAKHKLRINRYLEQLDKYVNETPIRIFNDDGIRIGLAFAEKYKSHIAESCFKRDLADIIYIIDLRTGNISIRSSTASNIDCSKIAEKYLNGGGHFNASGGKIDVMSLENDGDYLYIPMMPCADRIRKV